MEDMSTRPGDQDGLAALANEGQFQDVLVERPKGEQSRADGDTVADKAPESRGRAPRRGPRRREEPKVEASATQGSEDPTRVEETEPATAVVMQERVMGGLTIRDLEMMPKLKDIAAMKEIPVGGTTNIEAEVIGAIAGVSAQAVQGVASLGTTSLRRTLRERLGAAERKARGVEVEVGTREAILDINLTVVYGYSIPSIVVQVRQNVADRLLNLCGLISKEINIRVIGIDFPGRMPGRVQ